MLFIEEVLKRAVERLRETIPEEQDITLGVKPAPALLRCARYSARVGCKLGCRRAEEMKRRPVGKEDYTGRSCLHDDITAVIVRFSCPEQAASVPGGAASAAAPATTASRLKEEVVRTARDLFGAIDR